MGLRDNPYHQAKVRQRRRAGGAWAGLLPVLAAAAAAPLAEPVLFDFIDAGAISAGVEGLALRGGGLVVAALSLHTYADLVRGPDRAVLDPHPVQARPLLWAIAWSTARDRLYLPIGLAVLAAPLLLAGHHVAWLGLVGVLLGAYAAGLGVGFAVHLGAIWVGRSASLARLLDLLRGDNPRMQAALIYAPGAALVVAGLAVTLGAAGLRGALDGRPAGWAWALSPAVLGIAGFALALPLAERFYVRATALLTEVDGQVDHRIAAEGARGAAGASPEPVYLEWTAGGRREHLRALRQAWRSHRAWAFAAWLLGLSTLLAVWSDEVDVTARIFAVAGGGGLLMAALPLRLAEGDPPWLDRALGLRPGAVAAGRALTAVGYAQGVVLPGLLGALRHPAREVLPALIGVEVAIFIGSCSAAALAGRLPKRAAWLYGGLAVVAWAWIGGGFWARLIGIGGAG